MRKVGPERDEDQDQEDVARGRLAPGGDPVGEGVSDQKTQDSVHDGQPKGPPGEIGHEWVEEASPGVEVPVVQDRRAGPASAGEREHKDHQQRDGEEGDQVQVGRKRCEQAAACLLLFRSGLQFGIDLDRFVLGGQGHPVSASAASGWKSSTTCSPSLYLASPGLFSTITSTITVPMSTS